MTEDIDIKNMTGADIGSAAGNQQVETNSYNEEASDYPVVRELLDPGQEFPEPEAQTGVNPQAEHFRALAKEVDRMKAERETERRENQLQLDMLKANLNRQNQPETPKERQFLDSMNAEDIPSVGELRKEWQERESIYETRIQELQVAQMHPDYAEVVEKFAVPLVQSKPHLAEGLRGATNKAMYVYELGKMAQQMQSQSSAPLKSESAQRIVDNARKPGTLSQTGGQGALSKADYFATMSDREFMQFASRNLEGI
jgi:hypothetical protein